MFGDDIFIDNGFGGTDVFIDNGFGGTDVIIDNGYGGFGGTQVIIDNGFGGFGGTEVIVDNGWGMGNNVIIDNGYGMGGMGNNVIIEKSGGLFGRNQEIIINNGYGTTEIIQERRGLFGTREEVIVTNNNGWGGGNTTIIENTPFGSKEVIYNNNGYNGLGYSQCLPGCTCSVCIVRRPQQIQCAPNCMCQICVVRRPPPPVQCLPNCTCQVCIVRRPQQQQVQVPVGQPLYKQEQTRSPYGFAEERAPQKVQEQLLVSSNILELKFEKWTPRNCNLSNKFFDKHYITSVRKMKCRTNLEPFSNSLENGEIVMKVVVANQDILLAARSNLIREYFILGVLARAHINQMPIMPEFLGEMSGPILKKSEFLGNWQLRQVRITKEEGLKSYKKANEAHTLHIKTVRQIWTWFQVVQGNYLVLKIKNKMKTQFGIPLNQLGPWLAAFFSLLEDYQ